MVLFTLWVTAYTWTRAASNKSAQTIYSFCSRSCRICGMPPTQTSTASMRSISAPRARQLLSTFTSRLRMTRPSLNSTRAR
ncbi:hypothetical protein PR003_g1544 [Phytophthora rubi]|uniref:Secreted protein n=1 Tax=Phytophthora rubi TaxID=129364 RepID=A0A6A4G381_9STRA|nr:hypothetical protein PR003_g1544 [Phytophthora rubi]